MEQGYDKQLQRLNPEKNLYIWITVTPTNCNPDPWVIDAEKVPCL